MDWIKRNLLFVIGSVVSLALMGVAGYYLYAGIARNSAALEKLNAEYTELRRLNGQKPHPGTEKINNIQAAREQEQAVRAFLARTASVFTPPSPIPATAGLDEQTFATALQRTTDQMRKSAASAGVQLAPNYAFSFTAERDRIQFDRAGLVPLAIQLGEVKAICDILFAARINAIDGIRREKVSVEDRNALQSMDYLDRQSVTNDLAVISPYEVSIRCFSPELASILASFANAPQGLIVRAINVEPAVSVASSLSSQGVDMSGLYGSMPPPTMGFPQPASAKPFTPAPGGRGGLPALLDEKQLRVSLLIEVVKLSQKK